MRVVIDTSALIAALRSNSGAAAEVLRMALRGEFAVLMDYKLACEYREVALRQSHLHASGRSRSETEIVLDALESVANPVSVWFRHRPLSPDVNDDLVLDVAINGNADVILTNNIKDFRESAVSFGFELLTPAELVNKAGRKK